ncbi:transcription factor Spi-B isoform 3 [Daubentonia madagascariensis]|uniref:Transcription factor Spi-B isoform 3 n=1 Tax=Daubentonia madagascariensis TaxID=31869 RepID=A0ABD2D8E0_DAUMA
MLALEAAQLDGPHFSCLGRARSCACTSSCWGC